MRSRMTKAYLRCGSDQTRSAAQARQRCGAPAVQNLLVPKVLNHLKLHDGASEGAAGLHGSQQSTCFTNSSVTLSSSPNRAPEYDESTAVHARRW